MHCVYFARHGETVWNVENKICGMTDSPLTEKGRAQAAQLGEAVKNSGIVLDEILYSPLSRAADTALAVAAATGLPARVEPRLREQCFGRFEGTSPRNSPEFTAAKMQFADRYTDGESMLQLALGQLLAAVQLLLDPQDAVSFHGGSLLFIPYYKAEREGRQLLFLDRALRQLIQ